MCLCEVKPERVWGVVRRGGIWLGFGREYYELESIENMQVAWERIDNGEQYPHWDCDFCNLQTGINNAEVNEIISNEQAEFLREKNLRLERMGQIS